MGHAAAPGAVCCGLVAPCTTGSVLQQKALKATHGRRACLHACLPSNPGMLAPLLWLQVVRDINERQARELTDAAEERKRLLEQVGRPSDASSGALPAFFGTPHKCIWCLPPAVCVEDAPLTAWL